MVNKKFKVIEEGIMSVGNMKSLIGGCKVVTTCKPAFHDCRPILEPCECYSTSMYVTLCENKYGICGIVNGCGGKPDSEPYCKPILCPNNCPQNSSIIIN